MIAALRRTTELGLVVLAGLVTGGLYTLASLGTTASIPANVGPFLAFIFLMFGLAHVATRRLAPTADGTLLPIAGLLNGLGYVFIARLDTHLAGLQATWTAVGIGAYILTIALVRRTRELESYRYTFMFIGLGLLLLPLVPGIGRTINGARIWVSIGPLNFQPGEFAKIVLAIFFASYLVEKREILRIAAHRIGPVALPDLKHFGPVVLAWGTSLVVMIAERDLGSSLLFFALFLAMLWIATERLSYLAIGFGLFAVGAVFASIAFSHVASRIDVWLDPWSDASGAGYQVVQSQFSLAWGGITGTGPGLGNPGIIPAAESDFIFAAIGEELGLLGATAVLVAFLLIVGAGLRIALRAEAPFDKLLATGLTTIIGVQSFIIIGGVIRLVPLTGVTLPFVSYGGSSLVANYVLLGLLMRISAADDISPIQNDQTSSIPRKSRQVNKQIRRLGVAMLVLFGALFLQLNVVQVLRAEEYDNKPGNMRAVVRDYSRPRGQIVSADGTVLARSVEVEDNDKRAREYPEAELFGHITGYFSLRYNKDGVERSYNDELSGRGGIETAGNLVDLLLDDDHSRDVHLTIQKSVQQAARDALGTKPGAVVAVDPRDGSIIAMWSFPSFDPAAISQLDEKASEAGWGLLNADPSKPLLPRAFRESYFPGSTFKVVTAAAGLTSGAVTPEQPDFTRQREYVPPQTNRPIRNFGGSTCGGTLFEILEVSCNTAFSEMGVLIGGEPMVATARDFGFGERAPLDLPAVAPSAIEDAAFFEQNIPLLAQTAIGQQVRSTPLQMALVAAAVANGGEIMKPHVMADIRDRDGEVVRRYHPEVWHRAVGPEIATVLRDAMVGVAQNGTARALQVPNVTTAGKTGTAQLGNGTSHAWIIGFAPAEAPRVAIAVIVEAQPGASEQTGGRVAAPIGRAVLEAALAVVPEAAP